MKHAAAAALAAVLALAALAALAASSASPRAATITLGIGLEPPHLDPTSTSAEPTLDVVYANVFEGLTRIAEDGSVRPLLARDWTVSADGCRYQFRLQPGVRFHDGLPLSARDVKFSLDRARAANSPNPLHALLAALTAVEVVDELTVTLQLSRPQALLPTWLGWGNLAIVSPVTAAGNAAHPVGTGPFRLAEWRKGDVIVLERNPDYWGRPPRLAGVRFRLIPDASAALAALLAGDVDGFPNFPAPENLPQLARDQRFTVSVGSTEGETLVAINHARPPLDDLRVRQALSLAIDRQTVITGAMYGYGAPIGSHYPPHAPGYVDLTARYPYDPAASRALLAAAGYPHGFRLTLTLPPPSYARRSGVIVAAQLAAVGIRVQIEEIEWAQWLEQVFHRHDYDLTLVAHTEPMDYDIYARPGYYFGYASPVYAALYAELERSSAESQRLRLVGALQRQLADDAVNVFLFELPKLGVWRRELHGLWRNAPVQAIDVTGAWLDAPAAARPPPPARGSGKLAAAAAAVAALAALVALARRQGAAYLAGRALALAATLLVASLAIFALLQLLPGDPARYMLGLHASPEAVAGLRAEYGLDAPLWRQYLAWIGGALCGDFGVSYTYHVPVAELLGERLAVSVPLACGALALAVLMAAPLGLVAASRAGSRGDALLMGLAQLGLSIPNFWLGLALILGFAVHWHWFPAGGFPGWEAGVGAALAALTLPAVALALPQACILARLLRAAVGEALAEEYVRAARAKGVSRRRALLRHALPNALLPVLTLLGLQLSFLLAGAIIVETVFGLPGIGRLIFQASAQRDLIVVRSVVLLLVAAVVVVNFVVELGCAAVDPRLARPRPP